MITSFDLAQEIPYLLSLIVDFVYILIFITLIPLVVFGVQSFKLKKIAKKEESFNHPDKIEDKKQKSTFLFSVFLALFILLFLSIFPLSFTLSKYKVTSDHLSKLASAESTIIQLKASAEALDEKTGLDVELADRWIKDMRTKVRDGLTLSKYYELANDYNDLKIGYNKMTEWFSENTPEKIQQEFVDQLTIAKNKQVQVEQMALEANRDANNQQSEQPSESEVANKFKQLLD